MNEYIKMSSTTRFFWENFDSISLRLPSPVFRLVPQTADGRGGVGMVLWGPRGYPRPRPHRLPPRGGPAAPSAPDPCGVMTPGWGVLIFILDIYPHL